MKYMCLNCEAEFEEPKDYTETHGFTEPPYEEYKGCPECGSTEYEDAVECYRCEEVMPIDCAHMRGDNYYCENCYDDLFA